MNQLQPPEDFPFPFPPYDIQKDFMKKLFSVLNEGQLGIFESPTGTGKSLSLICGVLTWLKLHNDHYKAELLQKIEDAKKTVDEGPDWFAAATKRIMEKGEAERCQKELEIIKKQEERVNALKEHRKLVKNSRIQKLNDEFDDLFQDLHEVKEDISRELNAIRGENMLPPEEETLLLDNYDSDCEGEGKPEPEEDSDQGCLKIFYCSRTHSQLSQFVREIQKTVFGKEARVVSLASRQNLCVNEDVSKLPSISLINDSGSIQWKRGAKMALAEVNTTPLPLPLSTAKSLISRTCHASWDDTLADTLRTTSMGQYRTNSSQQLWVRKMSRVLDVALTRLRLGHTRLSTHLHRLRLVPDPHCPWCGTVEETIEHLLLHCPRFHSQRVLLQHQLCALDVPTFDLPALLAVAGAQPPRQESVICLTLAFFMKMGQLTRL
ncbi:ATP-dependent DNA helicase DDX11-like isoform X2 [Eriocheir sinensis]|uniref:ATP-dependent DNA helicase DDX11-like isoform X2 n=1 Tax=Eriocheir sinensis TaxID=95602 RepID=UPI0021C7BCDA|nr:ATP-dependent DNA helicase DDX11-like isoform X2 [Eriocheir sinensis]